MATRIEKHGKIMATFKLKELLTAGTTKKKAAKVKTELRRRNYVAPVEEAELV